jgi:hypothetical protein
MQVTRVAAVAGAVLVIAAGAAVGPRLLSRGPASTVREVVTLPVYDTYVNESKPDESYGSAKQLRADASPQMRVYLRFTVPGSPDRLVGADLRLYANAPDRLGPLVAPVHSAHWTDDITWKTAPPVGEPRAQGSTAEAGSWVSVDVRHLVAGPGLVDLALVSQDRTAVNYSSREDGEDHAPRLILKFAP